jgi:hypothetical protein
MAAAASLLFVAVPLAGAFQAADDSRPAAHTRRSPKPIRVAGQRLYPAPRRVRKACAAAQAAVQFPVLCPTILPRAADGTYPSVFYRVEPDGADQTSWLNFSAGYGVPANEIQLNTPRFFLHFVLMEGNPPQERLELSGTPYPQRLVGARTLGGRPGRLYVQPASYERCHCGFAGHYTFIWQEGGITYAASLHRWDRKATISVLGALIAYLRPVR